MHRLERLSEHLGGAVELWAKREDCNSGLAYGGNKVRKLEYLAAEALAQGCDTLVSIGGVQSNHTRQVAAVAARLGLACVLVQEHWVDWDDPGYRPSATSCCRGSWEPTFGWTRPGSISASARAGSRRWSRCGTRAASPTRFPRARPTTHWRFGVRALGARGAGAGARARRVLRHGRGLLGHRVDAGGDDRRVRRRGASHGACSGSTRSATVQQTWDQIARIARRTADAIGVGRELADDEIVLLDEWHAATYGIPDDKTIEAIRLARGWRGCSPTRCTRASRWRR